MAIRLLLCALLLCPLLTVSAQSADTDPDTTPATISGQPMPNPPCDAIYGDGGSCSCIVGVCPSCSCTANSSMGCALADCIDVNRLFMQWHRHYSRMIINDDMKNTYRKGHQDWWEETMIPEIIGAMQRMASQLSGASKLQSIAVGRFFDAKHQMETHNLYQELQLEAYEDYQPSDGLCTIGTAVRSIGHTEMATKTAALALNRRQMARHLSHRNVSGSAPTANEKFDRWIHFTQTYCDPQDNNWISGDDDSGLTSVCTAPNIGNNDRTNIDIDFGRLVENRRILDIYGGSWLGTGDELDIIALGNNLYGHNTLSRNFGRHIIATPELAQSYHKMRSIAAKRSVSENSFNNMVALRSQSSTVLRSNDSNTNMYLGKILQDLGIPEDEVVDYLGTDPEGDSDYIGESSADASYLATLEILTKKIFQNPNFYAKLYDTPANVKRKSTALKSFDLLLDRAIYESQIRREMALSVLLSARIDQYRQDHPNLVSGRP